MEELRPGIGRETERRKGPVEVEAEEGRKGESKTLSRPRTITDLSSPTPRKTKRWWPALWMRPNLRLLTRSRTEIRSSGHRRKLWSFSQVNMSIINNYHHWHLASSLEVYTFTLFALCLFLLLIKGERRQRGLPVISRLVITSCTR